LDNGGNRLQGLATGFELNRHDVQVHLSTRVLSISKGGVTVEAPDGTQRFIESDTVVYAVGQRPMDEDAEALRFLAPEYHRIGDCLAPKNIVEATRTGYYIARDIGRYI